MQQFSVFEWQSMAIKPRNPILETPKIIEIHFAIPRAEVDHVNGVELRIAIINIFFHKIILSRLLEAICQRVLSESELLFQF